MTILRNGVPVTIRELETLRADGRRMSRPEYNPNICAWKDAGPGVPEPEAPAGAEPAAQPQIPEPAPAPASEHSSPTARPRRRRPPKSAVRVHRRPDGAIVAVRR